MKVIGVRKPAIREPEPFVEVFDVDDQSIALPLSDGTPEKQGVVRISAYLAFLFAAIQVNVPPVVIGASHEDPDALVFPLFHELNTVGHLKHARPAWWQARLIHRVVF